MFSFVKSRVTSSNSSSFIFKLLSTWFKISTLNEVQKTLLKMGLKLVK